MNIRRSGGGIRNDQPAEALCEAYLIGTSEIGLRVLQIVVRARIGEKQKCRRPIVICRVVALMK